MNRKESLLKYMLGFIILNGFIFATGVLLINDKTIQLVFSILSITCSVIIGSLLLSIILIDNFNKKLNEEKK